MLKLPSLGELDQGLAVRVYLCTSPADMRRGFDTLAAMVRDYLGYDPLSGHLFLFVGRDKDRIKILYWDRDPLRHPTDNRELSTAPLPFSV